MNDVLDLVIRWLVPFVCGGIVSVASFAIGTVKNRSNKNREREQAISAGMQCLLRAEIISQYEKWTDRGYCPLYAKEALKREYDAYHALDGNDIATDLYRKTMALPVEPVEAQANN